MVGIGVFIWKYLTISISMDNMGGVVFENRQISKIRLQTRRYTRVFEIFSFSPQKSQNMRKFPMGE